MEEALGVLNRTANQEEVNTRYDYDYPGPKPQATVKVSLPLKFGSVEHCAS
jgi:hypothetical protein